MKYADIHMEHRNILGEVVERPQLPVPTFTSQPVQKRAGEQLWTGFILQDSEVWAEVFGDSEVEADRCVAVTLEALRSLPLGRGGGGDEPNGPAA